MPCVSSMVTVHSSWAAVGLLAPWLIRLINLLPANYPQVESSDTIENVKSKIQVWSAIK